MPIEPRAGQNVEPTLEFVNVFGEFIKRTLNFQKFLWDCHIERKRPEARCVRPCSRPTAEVTVKINSPPVANRVSLDPPTEGRRIGAITDVIQSRFAVV